MLLRWVHNLLQSIFCVFLANDIYAPQFYAMLLPPTNVVCEGYVFTGVCLSTGGVYSQGRVCSQRGSAPRGMSVPRGVCSQGGLFPERGVSRPTPKGEVEEDLVQAHTQGGSWRGSGLGPPMATAAGSTHPTGMPYCCECGCLLGGYLFICGGFLIYMHIHIYITLPICLTSVKHAKLKEKMAFPT